LSQLCQHLGYRVWTYAKSFRCYYLWTTHLFYPQP
jgi:hypothetical protein